MANKKICFSKKIVFSSIYKNITTLSFLILLLLNATAQKTIPLNDNTPVTENGITYSYNITNEKTKAVKGEDYDRFEITVTVINNSGCIKMFPFKINEKGELDNTGTMLAEFKVLNATGKRLTAKSAKLESKKILQTVKIESVTLPNNTNGIVQAVVGYGIKNGEIIKRNIIVIVPKSERPNVMCNAITIPDLL